MSVVVLVRHGETPWSANGRHTSVTDLALTPGGRIEAASIASSLAGRGFAMVLTSPRLRAIETCGLAGFGEQGVIDPDLAEWSYGDYEGLTSAEIEARNPGWSLFTDGCPGGEQPAAVAARADRVIKRCRAEPSGDSVLFAHGHILRVLGVRWIGLAPEHAQGLVLATAGIATLGYEHDAPVIQSWN